MLACRCEDCYDDVPASSSYFYPEKFFFEFSNLYNMATPWDALTIELLDLRWLNVYIGCMTIKCLRHLANFKDWFIWSRYTGITSLQLCFTLKQPKNPGLQASLIRFCPYKRNIPVHCRHITSKKESKKKPHSLGCYLCETKLVLCFINQLLLTFPRFFWMK